MTNPIIETMLNRKSIRKYTEETPSDEVIHTVVRAGQQAPFASQLCSLLLSRQRESHPFEAPLMFTICVDLHKMEVIMAKRDWQMETCDLSMLVLGFQDAILVAENMVIAAESLGMGSCFIGNAPYQAKSIIKKYNLPKRVFPIVHLVMGYPAENPPPRPRYPLNFVLFEDEYPSFSDDVIEEAMQVMDEGYLAQDYYRNAKYMVPLEGGRQESFTYDDYSWTEHISRKWGQWHKDPQQILKVFQRCGFELT